MSLAPGTRLGPYDVLSRIGAGGMGEVWQATDTNLKRQVALKILPETVAANRERLARFQREAEVLAALNHPNIAQIYGLEKGDGVTALVMELVDGPTLADRIAEGPIPVGEAVAIAEQIAAALEAAHEHGIIHRDLKPSNVTVRDDGTVKVLDFGLAKATEPTASGAPNLTTITSPAETQQGVILGTAAYMSPEQARGLPVDRRTDIWAFGCVLYEMLTGRRAFDGPTVSDVIANVLRSTPDWSRLPEGLPPALAVLVRRCLARDPRQRTRHIGSALLLLEEQAALSGPADVVPGPAGTSRRWWRRAPVAAAFVAGAALTAAVFWWFQRSGPPAVSRTAILADTLVASTDRNFAFTPDGSRLVFVSGDARRIMVRRMDQLEPATILSTTAYVRGVFPSPDGQWIGFVQNAFTLRKQSIAGGQPQTLAQMDGPSRGASWGPDDTVVFATGSTETGLQRVAASGGAVTVLTRPNAEQGEVNHVAPAWLPDGRGVLFSVLVRARDGNSFYRTALIDLDTLTWQTVIDEGYGARYVDGFLVYATADALWAVRFDLSRHAVVGQPVEVLRPVRVSLTGAVAHFDVAAGGRLAYPGDVPADTDPVVLVWVDREGRETPLDVPPNAYRHPRLSPDGRRLAVSIAGDIYVWDLDRPWSTRSRLTFVPGNDWYPVWTPDGRAIAFGGWRAGGFSNLYIQAIDGASDSRLTDSGDMQLPTAISPDGSTLVFHSFTKRLEALRLDEPGARPFTLVESPLEERNGVVSPDGRWLAYEAETTAQTGRLDIFVRPFPDVSAGLWQTTSRGGSYPAWCPRCLANELYYFTTEDTLVAQRVDAGAGTWHADSPVDLFTWPYGLKGDGSLAREYDVAPGGQRFLMLKTVRDVSAGAPHFVIVEHWLDELRSLMASDSR